tara:strand:- start:50 stop:169 length:120 start_codon:yes stop_codon:yes gene_type:complete
MPIHVIVYMILMGIGLLTVMGLLALAWIKIEEKFFNEVG